MPKRFAIEKILVALDGSDHSKRALDMTIFLAKKLKAKITAISIIDNSSMATISENVATYPLYEALQSSAQRFLDEAQKTGEEKKVEIETKLCIGPPANEILKLSVEFDLVVVGTMGKTGLSYFLLGSVADKVVRRCKVPVLVVPLKGDDC